MGAKGFIWWFYYSRLERKKYVGCQCKVAPDNVFSTTFGCTVALDITTPTMFWCVAFSVPLQPLVEVHDSGGPTRLLFPSQDLGMVQNEEVQ